MPRKVFHVSKGLFLSGFVWTLIWSTSASAASIEDSQITAAEAQIAEYEGNHAQAFAGAQKALAEDPNDIEALDLLIEVAPKVGRAELVAGLKTRLDRLSKRMTLIELAGKQLDLADADSRAGRFARAIERLEFIVRALKPRTRPDPGERMYEEALYRLELAELAASRLNEASAIAAVLGPSRRQEGLTALANAYSQANYFQDALRTYQAAARDALARGDSSMLLLDRESAQALGSSGLGLRASAAITYDSNPLGDPSGVSDSDGTPNNDLSSSLSLLGLFRGVLGDDSAWYYSAFFGMGQYRSIAQGQRAQFDSESLTAGATLAASSFPQGRAALRYGFQYAQSPVLEVQNGVSGYGYAVASRVHTLDFELSKDVVPRLNVAFNAHAYYGQYVTAYDSGIENRTGTTTGGFLYSVLRTGSYWFYPSLKCGADQDFAQGDAYYGHTFYARAEDYVRFGDSGADAELSIEYDASFYPRFSGGRTDFAWRPGIAINLPIVGHLSLLTQLVYGTVRSTASYYNQDRTIASTGLVFAL
jgi:tetratricopeptide (TPR) repeat protein